MNAFLPTLQQMAFLFTLIALGYLLARIGILPKEAAGILAKLENNLFIPALVLGTFVDSFTLSSLQLAWRLLLFSFGLLAAVALLSIGISRLCTPDRYLRNIYIYGLSFPNFSFMGNAIVVALFPEIYTDYLIFTLPLWVMIYLWGAPNLLMADSSQPKTNRFKALLNPMFICMFIGMGMGLLGIRLPVWLNQVVKSSGSCMSPVAMLLTGITIAGIDLRVTFKNIQIYLVTFLRLVVYPLLFIGLAVVFPPRLPAIYFRCAVCALAMPMGLNAIVIPSAYGKDTSVASGLALVSHLLACITIPLIFMLLEFVIQ